MALVIPQAFLTASATKSEKVQASKVEAATKTVGRIDMSADVAGKGLCPECRNPMKRAISAGLPVMYCRDDRIALPIEDEPAVDEAGSTAQGDSVAPVPGV